MLVSGSLFRNRNENSVDLRIQQILYGFNLTFLILMRLTNNNMIPLRIQLFLYPTDNRREKISINIRHYYTDIITLSTFQGQRKSILLIIQLFGCPHYQFSGGLANSGIVI